MQLHPEVKRLYHAIGQALSGIELTNCTRRQRTRHYRQALSSCTDLTETLRERLGMKGQYDRGLWPPPT